MSLGDDIHNQGLPVENVGAGNEKKMSLNIPEIKKKKENRKKKEEKSY